MLIHNKDDIEFFTEVPCFLGQPVDQIILNQNIKGLHDQVAKA